VIPDSDLAEICEAPTKRLNEQVKRNRQRFPKDFVFALTRKETRGLRSQIATLNQTSRGRHRKHLPFVFTEHGAVMAACIPNCRRAVQISVLVVRAFIRTRMFLTENRELAHELKRLEKNSPAGRTFTSSRSLMS
jgi:hypothetical protein